jgi:hypothetical protein
MMKEMTRNGIMFSCGWLPPANCTACIPIVASGAIFWYIATAAGFAQTLFVGVPLFPAAECASGV